MALSPALVSPALVSPALVSADAVRAARDLRTLVGRLRRRLAAVSPSDLTPSQVSVLSRLDREGAATASELAASEGVRAQSMSATLGALLDQGLVERTADPHDGRRLIVGLSDAGQERLEGDREARQEWLARAMQDAYSADERSVILEALELLGRVASA